MSFSSSLKLAPFLSFLLLSPFLSPLLARRCSILHVHGANSITGAGFGVINDGSIPRSGNAGDAGADATLFTAGVAPNPACGRVAKIPGNVVDIPSQTDKALAHGIPAVYSNGSIPLTVFQVNREGGGPMNCQYSPDATGHSWQPMDMTLNMPGNFGLQANNRVQYTVVATFRAGARLTGGAQGNLGLVRCRAGTQGTCGGCFLVQMDGQVVSADGPALAPQPYHESAPSLTSQQMSTVIAQVIDIAKAKNMVADSSS